MEGLQMNSAAVNLGAGGFVSYFEDGGAAVTLEELVEGGNTVDDGIFVTPEGEGPILPERMNMERGLGTFFAEQYTHFASPPEGARFDADRQSEIRASGNPNSEARETYYPEGNTFYETLQQDYDYPLVQDPIGGPNRHGRPAGRQDLPTPQELADTRGHMLGSALMAADYGPKTAMTVGNLGEDIGFSNRLHRAMDKRNNAVGISIFKAAGIDATPAQLAKMVDAKIFKQLDVIMGRSANDRSFKSPEKGPDLYIPRDQYGYFISEY
jgi:hypothetical protein